MLVADREIPNADSISPSQRFMLYRTSSNSGTRAIDVCSAELLCHTEAPTQNPAPCLPFSRRQKDDTCYAANIVRHRFPREHTDATQE